MSFWVGLWLIKFMIYFIVFGKGGNGDEEISEEVLGERGRVFKLVY